MSVMILSREAHTEYAAPALPDYLSGELTKEKILVNTFESYAKNGIQVRLNDDVVEIKPEEIGKYFFEPTAQKKAG